MLLNADILPADITISKWFFKEKTTTSAENNLAQSHRPSNVVAESDTVPKTIVCDDMRGPTLMVAPVSADAVGISDATVSVNDESIAIADNYSSSSC